MRHRRTGVLGIGVAGARKFLRFHRLISQCLRVAYFAELEVSKVTIRSRIRALLFLLAPCFIAQTAIAACPTYPAWNQVVVYTDANRGGSCAVLGVGDYGTTIVPNDSISSISLGWGVQATLYQNGPFYGNEYNFPNGPFTFNLAGWANDDASSIRVSYRVSSSSPPASFLASLPQDTVLTFPYSASATESATIGSTQSFDLGRIKAGTTLRLGTCPGGADLPGANASGDTYLRVFFDGVEQAEDDDGGGVAYGASYMSYTVPYSGNITVKAGCFSNDACSGTLKVAYGEPDSNGTIQNVQAAFDAITGNAPRRNKLDFRQNGKVLGAYTYSIWHEPHFQGLQRVPRTLNSSPDDRPKFILSGSDNADLYTVQFALPYCPVDALVGPLPSTIAADTKVIGNSCYGSYYDSNGRGHLGSLQASGRWLAGGIEQGGGAGPSTLRFWDLSQLPNPVLVREMNNSTGSAGEVALTKLPGKNQGYVMFVGGQSSTTAQVWTLSGQFGYGNMLTTPWQYRGLVTMSDIGGLGFQSLNFVNQDDGQLFLVGMVGAGTTNPEAGTDTAILFKVSHDSSWNFSVQQVSSRVFICDFDSSRQCAFNAAAGVFVDPDENALRVYASKAWRPDDGNSGMTFVEFY